MVPFGILAEQSFVGCAILDNTLAVRLERIGRPEHRIVYPAFEVAAVTLGLAALVLPVLQDLVQVLLMFGTQWKPRGSAHDRYVRAAGCLSCRLASEGTCGTGWTIALLLGLSCLP